MNKTLLIAYELFLENKNSNQDEGKGFPIKKIFFENDSVTLDDTAIQTYGQIDTSTVLANIIQKNLDMPIDTNSTLNIPKKIVAPNSPKPYVVIPGFIKIQTKKNQKYGEITLGDKRKGGFAKMSIPNYDEREIESADIPFKPDKHNYLIDNAVLYDVYCQNKILVNDTLPADLFKRITTIFFDYVKSKDLTFTNGTTSFLLYILPNNKPITYKHQSNTNTDKIDSFGNNFSVYHDGPSTGVFFLSYDDKAFTINCKEKQEFYQSIGIGKETLSKILLPTSKKMNIAGFEWYFINLSDAGQVFDKKPIGIYGQMCHNYIGLNNRTKQSSPNLLIFCIKKTNAKLEVMIHENMSLSRLANIFADITLNEIPMFALEKTLIITRGQSTIYRHYMAAIKSILNGTTFDKVLLYKIFTHIIQINIRNWLDENHNEAYDFFKRSEFCKKCLKIGVKQDDPMESQAEFAKKIGNMARVYIDFRKKKNLENKSFQTILTKPKYDIKTLQGVVKQIGRSIHLLSLDKNDYNDILGKISDATPAEPE